MEISRAPPTTSDREQTNKSAMLVGLPIMGAARSVSTFFRVTTRTSPAWESLRMSAPSEDDAITNDILAALESLDDVQSASSDSEAVPDLDVEALRQSLNELKENDVQQWKDAFGSNAEVTDIDHNDASSEEDEGFEIVGTF